MVTMRGGAAAAAGKSSASRWPHTLVGVVIGIFLSSLYQTLTSSSDVSALVMELTQTAASSSDKNDPVPSKPTTVSTVPNVSDASHSQALLAMSAASSRVGGGVLSSNKPAKSFFGIANHHGTDKIRGTARLASCLKDSRYCTKHRATAVNPQCRIGGHYYDSIYQRWLGPWSAEGDEVEPFQFLEIGYYTGKGFDAYSEFLSSNRIEKHSMEISCIEAGPRAEGKWPWGNFAAKNRRYQALRDANRLHCMDASNYTEVKAVWDTHMNRSDAPPLKVVIDDGSHLASHIAVTLFFWFPRLAPGGLLILEDIEPNTEANPFRKHVIPQVVRDIHWCGLPEEKNANKLCFPTIQPLLKSVHCELHICVLERNHLPAVEYDEQLSAPPGNALDSKQCV